jgi:hypothetical protein
MDANKQLSVAEDMVRCLQNPTNFGVLAFYERAEKHECKHCGGLRESGPLAERYLDVLMEALELWIVMHKHEHPTARPIDPEYGE